MNREPTVLDFVKSIFKGKPLAIPDLPESQDLPHSLAEKAQQQPDQVLEPAALQEVKRIGLSTLAFPWRSLMALGLALIAQISLLPRANRTWIPGVILYACAAGWLAYTSYKSEWSPADLPKAEQRQDDYHVRSKWLYASLPLALVAFLLLGGNRFTPLNVTLWVLAIIFTILAFWQGEIPIKTWWNWLKNHLHFPLKLSLTAWTVLVVLTVVLVVFFRVYRINQVPSDMVSDHAEKLLDIWDVLHGQTSIFFPRNTGREAIQMYLTAGIIQLLHTGYSFLSLKIGTILLGLLTLPYVYLLGKELGNRRVGLFAVLFAGIGYWPNVISRIGLRFPLYPLFVAPTLYYLIRGLRTSNRNDFLLAGLALGIGLHGYTPIRFLPIVVLVAVGLYLLHPQARGKRLQVISGLMVLVLISLIVFLPLLRFALENPTIFNFRAFSRLGTTERALPGPALLIFLKNLWNASVMFFWSDGNVWVHSVTNSPALDVISAALFFLGSVLLFVRYIRRRTWQDFFLLLSVPLLMMPSILSLAFPDENPALNRAAGALIPVFIIVAIALDGLMSTIEVHLPARSGANYAWGMAIFLVFISAMLNYDLVFNQYARSFQLSAWNTSEMGQVIRDFGTLYGGTNNAYVVPYPYWVDTRLVGMIAGDTTRDFAIQPDQIATTLNSPQPKLFLLNPQDETDLNLLRQRFPQGIASNYASKVGKDFYIYMVPAASSNPAGAAATGELSPP
jgi:4-amino-4-deoxy-L-arabinose transferase-like glycosyltransferase